MSRPWVPRLCGSVSLTAGREIPASIVPRIGLIVLLGAATLSEATAGMRGPALAASALLLPMLGGHFFWLARLAWQQWVPVLGHLYLMLAALTWTLAGWSVWQLCTGLMP